MKRAFYLFLFINYLTAAQTSTTLRLNEIMFYPSSGNNEFIEVFNTSPTESFDLNGYMLKYYTSSPDVITDAGEGTTLPPLSYAVVFESDYDIGSGIYHNLIPQESLILKISDNSFGSTGMANTSDRPIWLLSSSGDTIDVYTYTANNSQTHSDEKIHVESDSSQTNWSNSIPSNGTPGFRNSVTPLDYDLKAGSIIISPEIPIEGDDVSIEARIINTGQNSAGYFTVLIFNDTNLDSIPQPDEQIYSQEFFNLSPGDSISAYTGILSASAGFYNVIARVDFTQDEDTLNNTAIKGFTVYSPGNNYNDVVINEIMYAPSSGEPEWIELYNRTQENVNLHGWKFSDNSTTVLIIRSDKIIPPGSFIVVAKDSSILNYYSVPSEIIEFNLPALNNTGDAVVIKDSLGIIIDSLFYLPSWGGNVNGRSLERISPDESGIQQSNWSTSESIFKATPGEINSVTPKNYDLKISSFKSLKEYGIIGEQVNFEIKIKNAGLNLSLTFSISLFNDANRDSIPAASELVLSLNSVSLLPGDSVQFILTVTDFQEGENYFISTLAASPDDDTTNNIAFAEFTGVAVNELRNDLVLNEFMYDPDPPQPEWIEIFNRSNKPINLKNYQIADGSDTVIVCKNSLLLNPQEYAVIGSDSTIVNFFNIPSYLIIKALPVLNNSGDKIILLDSLDRVIDSLQYDPFWGGEDGKSLERIKSENSSIDPDNWSSSIGRYNATPGYLNSVTQKENDIGVIDIISSPGFPVIGDNVELSIKVKNYGMLSAAYSLNLYEDTDLDSLPDIPLGSISNVVLQSGDSAVTASGYTINNLRGLHNYYVEAVFNPDMDTSNNYFIKNIYPGYPPSTVVVNEIMYKPFGGEPEWIEVFNTSGDSISLRNWTVSDVITTPAHVKINTNVIPPQEYLVIAHDSTIYDYHRIIPSGVIEINLPVLNNDEDGIVIKDSRGQTMDSVFFRSGWGGTGGYSLERISTSAASNLSTNWNSSDDIEFSTPGRVNSITPKIRDIKITKISSEPEFPVEGSNIFISAGIKNDGSLTASDLKVEFYIDSDSNQTIDRLLSSITGITLNPEDSVYIMSAQPIQDLSSGILTAVRVIFQNDEDTLNNYAERFVQYGFGERDLLINEIMYDPSDGEPEWIELFNNSTDSLNLKDWSVSDLLTEPTRDFITTNDFYLQPGGFAVIAKDTSFYIYHPNAGNVFITNFGTLGNSKDGIIIYDFRDAGIDTVEYQSDWGGKNGYSLERISVSGASDDSSNWSSCLSHEKSTPGKPNSVVNIPQAERNSLVINEIMYDPGIDNCDFIEFYNNSNNPINAGGWRIEDEKENFHKLSDTSFVILAGDYFVLAADSIILKKYNLKDFKNISFAGSSGLGLSNSGELIRLKDLKGCTVDSVFYSPDWNNRNINITKNKSLERINPQLNSNLPQNWSTCVNSDGATPDKQNSIYTTNENKSAGISVSPNPFSPDNDGFEDFSIINYSLTQAVSQIRIKIFDSRGRLVRTLANNQPSASNGSIVFDGLGDDGQALRMGIYIIFLEALNSNTGVLENLKTVVVIARKL